jgi:hypothetical protein
MGRASSAKKVARVAKVGGKSSTPRRNIAFPLVIVFLLAAGGLAVFAARSDVQANNNPKTFPALNKDHIHEAYGIYDCNKWLAPIPTFESSAGIHTHGDGVLHIHPYSLSASGRNARFSVFEDGAGMSTSPSGLRYTGVSVKGPCNGKPAVLRVAEWDKVVDAKDKPLTGIKPTKIYLKDFGKIRLDHNGGALTFYYGPADAPIPLPPSIPAMISALGGNDNITPAPTTVVPPTTVKGSATTVKGAPTTVAPGTTAKGAPTTAAPATTVAPTTTPAN